MPPTLLPDHSFGVFKKKKESIFCYLLILDKSALYLLYMNRRILMTLCFIFLGMTKSVYARQLFYVQVAAFEDESAARTLAATLTQQVDRSALVQKVNVNRGSGTWYRVVFGPFRTGKLARDFVTENEFKADYPDTWVYASDARATSQVARELPKEKISDLTKPNDPQPPAVGASVAMPLAESGDLQKDAAEENKSEKVTEPVAEKLMTEPVADLNPGAHAHAIALSGQVSVPYAKITQTGDWGEASTSALHILQAGAGIAAKNLPRDLGLNFDFAFTRAKYKRSLDDDTLESSFSLFDFDLNVQWSRLLLGARSAQSVVAHFDTATEITWYKTTFVSPYLGLALHLAPGLSVELKGGIPFLSLMNTTSQVKTPRGWELDLELHYARELAKGLNAGLMAGFGYKKLRFESDLDGTGDLVIDQKHLHGIGGVFVSKQF